MTGASPDGSLDNPPSECQSLPVSQDDATLVSTP